MFINNINKGKFWKRRIWAIAAVSLLIMLTFGVTGCNKNSGDEDIEIEQQELDQDTVNFGNDGVSGGIAPDALGPDDVTLVSQQTDRVQSMVSMSVEDTGRADPFLPYGSSAVVRTVSKGASYDLLPPPESITVDTTATEVMTTKVSGIMFDKFNPSAILNIAGSDYLVRTGDIVNNYKVLSIAKEYVAVQYGANVYKAGVGELFTGEGINYNTVSNLEHKFGGNRKK
mgnify:CR=1 FL=1